MLAHTAKKNVNEDKYLSNYHNFMQLCVPWELVQCRAACNRGQDKM